MNMQKLKLLLLIQVAEALLKYPAIFAMSKDDYLTDVERPQISLQKVKSLK
ncbi:Uncharacterised protein [Acinetobacter baumannii]|uniref:Uncharacterized protein n=1 Tax=Acinetobacter baumannii WM99c TaxID=945555 RepID=A0A385F0A9_ACIBA|nr:hypothetical protein [Acinetobacter baumannii]AGG91065.1 hypothetical protein ABTJ_p2053 [Acinetobacter baumannii MDR-TJ]AXQ92252.1 hypothetical protein BSF95_05052 [Acinetobacter baumannii WM99c]MCG5960396.1 hypothetical protein [Acinetobacter baumannii]MDV4282688.1 hypothetical protein [Acinetobacter baumannii]QDM68474.1 hypothetical protein FK728_p300059 [Acinetobacter baumannii]